MHSALDIANFFIDMSNTIEEDFITNMKLNKLLYFAQGLHIARYKEPLFAEQIEAWHYGPVVKSVYQKYKVCGKEPIKVVDEDYCYDRFNGNELDTLVITMREYGKYTAITLTEMTHTEGPWKQAYHSSNAIITFDAMLEYFSTITEKINSPAEQLIQNSELVKAFPKEWYNPAEDEVWKLNHV